MKSLLSLRLTTTSYALCTAVYLVISDAGSAAYSDIIAGVNYVVASAASSGRPTIATMSLGGSTNTALDSTVTTAIAKGAFHHLESLHV